MAQRQQPTMGPSDNESDRDVRLINAKLDGLPIATRYPAVLATCRPIIQLFHDSFSECDAALWSRMKRAIPKELNESAFIIDAMLGLLDEYDINAGDNGGDLRPYTVIDVCSGVGYLSMFLSHLLPPEKCSRIVAIDTLFELDNTPIGNKNNVEADGGPAATDSTNEKKESKTKQSNHLSTSHLTKSVHPIPIRPRKANIKKGRELRQIAQHCVEKAPGPVVILGVHLCKALSVHTVRLFNMTDAARLYLKPCCLPGRRELRRRDPPFWTFNNMPGGGFGVKSLYCAEGMANKDNDDEESEDSSAKNLEGALKQIGREAGHDDAHQGRESTADGERGGDQHNHVPSGVRGHALFDRWTCLLKEAADTSDEAVTAKIHHCSVQQRHFQNQYIVAKRQSTTNINRS